MSGRDAAAGVDKGVGNNTFIGANGEFFGHRFLSGLRSVVFLPEEKQDRSNVFLADAVASFNLLS